MLFFLLAIVSVDSQVTLTKKVGDSVVLRPDSVPSPITGIGWKHGLNLAMEWDGVQEESFRHFKERGNLNISTGEMRITGLTREDSGMYTVYIDYKFNSETRLIVLNPVPKPNVAVSCDTGLTTCLLTCNGDTRDVEQVTYRWRKDDTITTGLPEHNITTEEDLTYGSFSCIMMNPVSQETSNPVKNPLIPLDSGGELKLKTGLIVFISLITTVLVAMSVHRWKAGVWFYQKASMPWEADFWRRSDKVDAAHVASPSATEEAQSNANSAATEQRQPEEEGLMTEDGKATTDQ